MEKFKNGDEVVFTPTGRIGTVIGMTRTFDRWRILLKGSTTQEFWEEEHMELKPPEEKIIFSVVKFRLSSSAGNRIPYNTFAQVEKWLEAWTPVKNIEAIICADIEEGLKIISEDFSKLCKTRFNVSASEFEAQIAVQKVKDNRFWLMTHGSIHGTWYQLKD